MNCRVLCLVSAAMAVAPALAHHSFVAQYDRDASVSLTGVITKVEWQSPHIWFYPDVTADDGTVTNWAISGGSPGQLARRTLGID